jgi:hypothetical protein
MQAYSSITHSMNPKNTTYRTPKQSQEQHMLQKKQNCTTHPQENRKTPWCSYTYATHSTRKLLCFSRGIPLAQDGILFIGRSQAELNSSHKTAGTTKSIDRDQPKQVMNRAWILKVSRQPIHSQLAKPKANPAATECRRYCFMIRSFFIALAHKAMRTLSCLMLGIALLRFHALSKSM